MNQNQRLGLTEVNGDIVVGWGFCSDWGVYHGWLMAFDPGDVRKRGGVQSDGFSQLIRLMREAGHRITAGRSVLAGWTAPAVDGDGYIYLNAADGSFRLPTAATITATQC